MRRERNVPEIQSMYETSFQKLSDRYYKSSPWPAVELIADVVDQDHVFCLLYKVRTPLVVLKSPFLWPADGWAAGVCARGEKPS